MKPMQSWGDLNVALNRLVREGVIESFRTNRADDRADPAVDVVASARCPDEVRGAVKAVLTGVFAEATIRVLVG